MGSGFSTYDVFISYSRKDMEVADSICASLSAAGLTYFIDREGIEGGRNFPQVLADAVDGSTVFLFLASQNSFRSRFTRGEVTYAFNHKPSGVIIPYIIDGSETMPSDLELMLGNFNWRRREQCTVDELIRDIRSAMENPEGTVGGHRVLTDKKKKFFLWAAIVVILMMATAMTMTEVSSHKTRKLRDEAVSKAGAYEEMIVRADSLVRQADELKGMPNSLETTDTQTQCLKLALALLDRAEKEKEYYLGSEYAAFFNKDREIALQRTAAEQRLDSMFTAWAGYARDSYELFEFSHKASEARNVIECIDHALLISNDPELIKIKNNLQ